MDVSATSERPAGRASPLEPSAATAAPGDAIPFFPPRASDAERRHFIEAVEGVARSGEYILGSGVRALERLVGEQVGREAVAVGSGTVALEIALRCAGVAPGDEVIVPAFGCQPIASSVVAVGARPVFADVHERTLTLDPASAEGAIGERTRALMPAHVFSSMADMPAFDALGRARGIPVVEDACVQFGGVQDGVRSGTSGVVSTFSFAPVKVLGACGDGGMVMGADAGTAQLARMLRNHGQDGKTRFLHHVVGYNYRMDEVIARYLLARHADLPAALERRRRIAEHYLERLAPFEDRVSLPRVRTSVDYLFVVLMPERDALRASLARLGIEARTYYPAPLPAQPAFAEFATADARFPVAERASRENLALPSWPGMTDAEVEAVAEEVASFLASR